MTMGVHQTPMSSWWFDEDEDSPHIAETPDPDLVWARVGDGKLRLMERSEALSEGFPIDDRPGRGAVGRGDGGVRREFMSAKEREEVFLKTGVRVEDRNDVREAFKATGLRDAEPGEHAYEQFDAIAEASASKRPIDEKFREFDFYGDAARSRARGPMNVHERLEQLRYERRNRGRA